MLARPAWRHWLDWGLVVALFGVCALLAARLDEVAMRRVEGRARVVDGDTLALDGRRVRILGIDAFEAGQACRRDGEDYDCGAAARAEMTRLAGQGGVECRGRTFDRYDRLLAACTAGGKDIAASMVLAGWALAYGDYETEERVARGARRGAWAGEFDAPAAWRANRGGPVEERHDWLRWLLDLLRQLLEGGTAERSI